MFHHLFIWLASIFIFVSPGLAQQTTLTQSWCPLSKTAETIFPTPTNYPVSPHLPPDVGYHKWSTDGAWIAFTRRADNYPASLWVIRPDGTDERELISPDQLSAMRYEDFEFISTIHSFDWIPERHLIALNTWSYPVDGFYVRQADDLWTVNADTGELVNLFPQGEGGEFQFTPDGATIVVTHPDGLDLIAFDGSFLYRDVLPDYDTLGLGDAGLFYPQMLWSDQYQAFLVAVIPSEQRDWLDNGHIRVWSVPLGITPELIGEFFGSVFTFKMSPDGNFVAWEVWLDSEKRQLYISSIDGSEQFMFLEHDLLRFSRWMPDSRHFLYDEELDGESDSHADFIGDICGSSKPNENE